MFTSYIISEGSNLAIYISLVIKMEVNIESEDMLLGHLTLCAGHPQSLQLEPSLRSRKQWPSEYGLSGKYDGNYLKEAKREILRDMHVKELIQSNHSER